jgi:hypothetical protein
VARFKVYGTARSSRNVGYLRAAQLHDGNTFSALPWTLTTTVRVEVTYSGGTGPTASPTSAPTASPSGSGSAGGGPDFGEGTDGVIPHGLPGEGTGDNTDANGNVCADGQFVGPISHQCKDGGTGYGGLPVCPAPDGFNPLDWLGYIGCVLGQIPTMIANALAWIMNAILDLFIPSDDPLLVFTAVSIVADTKVPFGWVSQVNDALATVGSTSATVDTSFTVAGFTVNVPLYSSLAGVAPYRGLIAGIFILIMVLAVARTLRGALGVGGGSDGGGDS